MLFSSFNNPGTTEEGMNGPPLTQIRNGYVLLKQIRIDLSFL